MGKMTAELRVIFLSAIFLATIPLSQQQTNKRKTIFDDEKLEGGPFEKADYFNGITLDSVNPYRLPTTTRPVHYDILWTVNITDFSFSGEVDIYLYATQPNVNEIILHAHELSITSLELYQEDVVVYQTYTLQPAYHFLRVLLTNGSLVYNETAPVTYKLSISFNAPLRTDMNGMYRSWFRTETSEISWLATTFFAPTGARLAFPCYDEPSFKAKFQITIRRPIDYKSWACTRKQITRNVTNIGFQDDVFFPTPIMSTYILAIVVAKYESTEPEENGEVMHEVILRPYDLETRQGDYAQEVGIKLLDAMSVHTGIDYYSVDPEIKMSHVAIPDFSAGAMENWGLVSYREALLLYDENQTSSHNKHRIASLLAHEIAHMWFGNLVTCDWWGVTWLNEGFGRYYEYYLTDMVKENEYMKFPTRFIPEQVHTSLLSDASDNPHPLSNPNVGSPDAAWAMFSIITYNKGASVIRMTEHLLGSDVHKEGTRRYLNKRYLDTALPIHLFESLQEAAEQFDAISIYGTDFNVIDYYKTWTEQAGYPLLSVYINHSTGEMTIYQGRFNINTGYSTASTKWIIPINFATANNPDFNVTKPSHIIRESVTIINRMTTGDQWTIFNKQQTGFYRVHYDDYTWKLITMALKSSERSNIHELNRAQIVDDVFQFARSGIMNYTEAFNILSFLRYETDYAPWAAAIAGFNWLSNRFVGTAMETGLNELFMGWASNVMDELTFNSIDGEPHLRSYLRFQLAPVMCRIGYQPCRDEARRQFDELKINNTDVPADDRNWVYCNGLRYGDLEDFDLLWKRFLTHEVHNEKTLILTTLGCTPIEGALNEFLDEIIEPSENIRPQDYTSAFNSAVTGNQNNTQIVFRYIQSNLQGVIDAFGSATTPLSYISSRLRTVEEVEEFRDWAVSQQGVLGTSFQTVYNSAQTSMNALQWAQDVEEDIKNYLDNGDSPFNPTTTATVQTTIASTVTLPPILELTTPFLEDSANIVNLSYTLISLNVLVYFLL